MCIAQSEVQIAVQCILTHSLVLWSEQWVVTIVTDVHCTFAQVKTDRDPVHVHLSLLLHVLLCCHWPQVWSIRSHGLKTCTSSVLE
jgi:hypothetical protein